MFGLFRRRRKENPQDKKKKAAADGFGHLVYGVKQLGEGEVQNNVAVAFVLYYIHLSVRILINVAIAVGELEPLPATTRPRHKRKISRALSPTLDASFGRLASISHKESETPALQPASNEEEVSSDSFSFEGTPVERSSFEELMEDVECDSVVEKAIRPPEESETGGVLSSKSSLESIPEHALLRGFVKTPSLEKQRARVHVRHMSLDDRAKVPDLSDCTVEPVAAIPLSPFDPSDMVNRLSTEAPTIDDTIFMERELSPSPTPMEAIPEVVFPELASETEIKILIDEAVEIQPDSKTVPEKIEAISAESNHICESPCSSPRSVFSDSVAAEFFNTNFCNPEFCQEPPMEAYPTPGRGSSLRQRYTLKRLQSMMSQRSRAGPQTPSIDGSYGQLPMTPGESLQSFRTRSFRKLNCYKGMSSFRSRVGDDDGMPVLSDAYRLVRLESCIRRAWKISMDEPSESGGKSFREREGGCIRETPSMASFRKMGSRRFNRTHRISFVKVPADFSPEMLISKKEMLLNPYFGDAIDKEDMVGDDGLSDSDRDTINDTQSVKIRNPLKHMGSLKHTIKPKVCEKNFDEDGAYDNPMRLSSFRSYDSDTELELSSVRDRNPISRLLSFRVLRGLTKDGIPLAEIGDDEYGAMLFDQVKSNPINDGLLDRYLTQVAINKAAKKIGTDPDMEREEDTVEWSTCDQDCIPQETDDQLKCLLLDRFLLNNVLNEMDVNLGALELARVKGRTVDCVSAKRQLRRC